jgi:hypothetical protein
LKDCLELTIFDDRQSGIYGLVAVHKDPSKGFASKNFFYKEAPLGSDIPHEQLLLYFRANCEVDRMDAWQTASSRLGPTFAGEYATIVSSERLYTDMAVQKPSSTSQM